MRSIDKDGGSGTAPSQESPNISSQDITSKDLDQLWQWNQTVPPLLQTCMHDLITQVSKRQPTATAIESWDGSLTYHELEDLSTRLAYHLISKGATVGTRIPLCFEKSLWAVVALLGVMKSGATFSLTDPSQPEARLRTIVEQTGAEIVVTSVAQSQLGHSICPDGQVLAISRDFFECTPPSQGECTLPDVPASSPMYIIFTSGSTGKPKGVIISHENYTSGAIPRADAVGYKAHSRCFDFPSYAFDVSIDCMLCTLAAGGCICVPSEEDRVNDLSGAIRKSKANMVHMTPSVARVLDADIIPSLEVLGLGGEAVSSSDASVWSQSTALVIAYGPSECTVGCTINNTVTQSTGIGKGVGGVTWIVDLEDHNRLTPIGEVGELIIEGPVVGVGYLDEPAKTAEVFIEDPKWLLAGYGTCQGRRGRLYKTGDLVRYEKNGFGDIEFVGRKDQQVKLRGQRVELAEVEHHLRLCLPQGVKVAAEVIKSQTGVPTLVAFLSEPGLPSSINDDEVTAEPSNELTQALVEIDETMGARVPRYMVPAAFITLSHMPTLVSGKIDRKRLRDIGISLPREKLSGLPKTEEASEDPRTEDEKELQQAWRDVLGTDSQIFRQSNFFAVGGDSLRAMRLVAAARERGMSLTVASIFMNPVLSDMAARAIPVSTQSSTDIPPFSLLDGTWDAEKTQREAAALCNINLEDVEDVYPCTPLQEALMALSAKVKEAYVAQRVVHLSSQNTAERLLSAFRIAERDCAILRTRVVQIPGQGLVQVVVNKTLEYSIASNVAEYLQRDRDDAMELGRPLVRYALVNDALTGEVSFVLSMHHALYDGWAMPLIVERVNKAYLDETAVVRPANFRAFIRYLKDMDRKLSAKYWQEQLQGAASVPQFPSLPFPGYQPRADSLLETYISTTKPSTLNITIATIIRAAWALVVSQYLNTPDIIFGETLAGRNAPIVGVEAIEGPMITTVPVRIRLDPSTPTAEYLQDVQDQVVGQIPHEHFGLQHIRRLGSDALEACELRTGLVLHPGTEKDDGGNEVELPASRLVPAGDAEAAQEALKFNTYALMLVCSIDPNGFLVMASFDSNTAEKNMMERVLEQFNQVAQSLLEGSGSVGDVECLTQGDVEELKALIDKPLGKDVLDEYPGAKKAYIVSSSEPRRLLPVGARGELIIESNTQLDLPILPRPASLTTFTTPTTSNLYITNKLAKYTPTSHIHIFPSLSSAHHSSTPPVKHISATTRKQRLLRSLWSQVLHIPASSIGLSDNFFTLGGDSISAMKLVSEARAVGVRVSVVQIFGNRTLFGMAGVMEESDTKGESEVEDEVKTFELLDVGEKEAFVRDVVQPQLKNPEWKIDNVLPTRPLQDIAIRGTTQIPRFSCRYELISFPSNISKSKLFAACRNLVQQNEILRTVFIEDANTQTYAVVLQDLDVEIADYEVDTSVGDFAKQLCYLDVQTKMPLGSSFVKFFFVQDSSGETCLIFRISHAQYDEICLPLFLRQLSNFYENEPVNPTIPFSKYVGHVVKRNIPDSVTYWKDLLTGSTLSVLKPDIPVTNTRHFAIERTIDISFRPRTDITIATLPTAAWALALARRLSSTDVLFGEVVSGRNLDFSDAQVSGGAANVAGPCWQYVPVRVKFEKGWKGGDLLRAVQDQHIASSAHEGVGLPELIQHCDISWNSLTKDSSLNDIRSLWFDSVVHQDVEHVETLNFSPNPTSGALAGSFTETLYCHEEPLREWKVQAFVGKDETLTVEIVTVESWKGVAREVLDEVVGCVEELIWRSGEELCLT